MLRHYLLLNQRKCCIAAAEAEHADLQKAQKKLPVNHLFFSFLFRIRVRTTPSTIQKITT